MPLPKVSAEVTVGMAARILGCSTDTIGRMCEEGKLRARRIGERGWWRIDYASIIELLQGTASTSSPN